MGILGIPARELAILRRPSRPLDRQQRKEPAFRILQITRQESDRRIEVRPPRQGRRDCKALFAHIVDLGIGVNADAGDAVKQLLVLIERTADVKRTLDAVERTTLKRNFAEGLFRRALPGEAAP